MNELIKRFLNTVYNIIDIYCSDIASLANGYAICMIAKIKDKPISKCTSFDINTDKPIILTRMFSERKMLKTYIDNIIKDAIVITQLTLTTANKAIQDKINYLKFYYASGITRFAKLKENEVKKAASENLEIMNELNKISNDTKNTNDKEVLKILKDKVDENYKKQRDNFVKQQVANKSFHRRMNDISLLAFFETAPYLTKLQLLFITITCVTTLIVNSQNKITANRNLTNYIKDYVDKYGLMPNEIPKNMADKFTYTVYTQSKCTIKSIVNLTKSYNPKQFIQNQPMKDRKDFDKILSLDSGHLRGLQKDPPIYYIYNIYHSIR
jgi:hypothetical protein